MIQVVTCVVFDITVSIARPCVAFSTSTMMLY